MPRGDVRERGAVGGRGCRVRSSLYAKPYWEGRVYLGREILREKGMDKDSAD